VRGTINVRRRYSSDADSIVRGPAERRCTLRAP
jgi:hypothetical protein